ncbi:hypothetical protein KL930_002529 [Ogataea haglerorum]|uniref:ATP-grasp domain-containing protein n=1 Tax=Ogataea haglerorum TaxID=1937702 RepID=A0AAN6D7L6_9ASCO|nr:hypothetical protein KL915_002284 [Ogataea haglerorum]KAG7729288.1 hypothetical protein KL933_001514 [Ogataea haglerorum]KAG7737752.1 hypothetical protein KL932_004055 [Ogataea haglerorum]KAG7759556.1 hypothetical protein KL947_001937 [Ogataea haglerorum]KAG7778442.1 hypothetical protein KL930_002529 [Ogataea haglerorum]
MMSDKNYMANSYIYRKGLIRKHYLANTIAMYASKNPTTILKKAFPETYQLELDYAEFLDDSLDESYELRQDLEQNEQTLAKTYILKPSMSDKGQGIRIFQTIDQLQNIFDSFEESEENGDENAVITSQLRHFIVQEYIASPLLLPEYENRKFHIRTYVLCVGDLRVLVYQRMLMLFSDKPYHRNFDTIDGHLTNTCLQGDTDKLVVVELGKSVLPGPLQNHIRESINSIVGELFRAASNDKINFQPLSNCFETFGIDFVVDENLNVSLLEVNSYPDFKQTGDGLKGLIHELFDGIVQQAVVPFFGGKLTTPSSFKQVLELT